MLTYSMPISGEQIWIRMEGSVEPKPLLSFKDPTYLNKYSLRFASFFYFISIFFTTMLHMGLKTIFYLISPCCIRIVPLSCCVCGIAIVSFCFVDDLIMFNFFTKSKRSEFELVAICKSLFGATLELKLSKSVILANLVVTAYKIVLVAV